MTQQLLFELVSPEKLIVSKPVALVTVPGGEGDYGVLIGHSPMITTIRPGIIDVYEQSDTALSERIFVGGGFAEVTAERCTVLAEEAMSLSDINRADVTEQLKVLGEELAAASSDVERLIIENRVAVARAKLDAAA